jgi:DNA-directed RNA polymerase subunit M/transcription elongation factor TFIIS
VTGDLFGGLGSLGGLLGGLAKSVVPGDTPEGQLVRAQSDVADLRKQEAEILQEIGRQAYEADPGAWPQASRLQLIRSNLEQAEAAVRQAQTAQQEADAVKQAQEQAATCPQCGSRNPDGVKFCQECGTRLGAAAKVFCPSCGAENQPGTRFCGGCGARQEA